MCSKPTLRVSRRALLALALLLVPVLACGKKGDPMPPLRSTPAIGRDLAVSQQGKVIFFDIAYPATTVSGLALDGVDALELHLLTKPLPAGAVAPTTESPEFMAGAKLHLTLRGAELSSAIVGDRVQFQLPLPDPQPVQAFVYAARAQKNAEVSGFSNLVTLVPRPPMTPPRDLQAAAGADGVTLKWQSDPDGQGFDVFRREAQNRSYGGPIGRVGAEARSFVDKGVRYGQRYIYTVRKIESAEPLVHTDPAGEREVEVEDRYPPSVPANFVGLSEVASVRLRWDRSPESDVAGYILFRRDPNRDFRRLNQDLLKTLDYLDRGLASGLTYDYVIVAVDNAGNESPKSAPIKVTTR